LYSVIIHTFFENFYSDTILKKIGIFPTKINKIGHFWNFVGISQYRVLSLY